jgi:hypothetical protein
LREGVHSAAVILNILARQREPAAPITIMTHDALRLRHAPVAEPSAALTISTVDKSPLSSSECRAVT